jgi:hypothetical protein
VNKVKLAPNLAMRVAAKYIDLYPGEHGPSVRIKGQFDGEDGALYLPGKAGEDLETLAAAGIIPEYNGPLNPEKAVDLKPKRKEFELVLAQAAGEKFGRVTVVGAPVPGAKPTNGNGSHAPAAGNGHAPADNASLAQTYIDATRVVLDKVVPLYEAKEIGVSDIAVGSMVATLFIAKTRG